MSMTRWDPFQDLLSFRDELNQLLNRWFGGEERQERQERTGPGQGWMPVLAVVESKDADRIDMEGPGILSTDSKKRPDEDLLRMRTCCG